MYIDTDIIYALLKPEDRYMELAERVLKTEEHKYSSAALIIELELVLKREAGNEPSKKVLDLLQKQLEKIELKPVDKKTLELSIKLRQEYDLGIFDSLHVACALLNDRRIASTDESFDKVAGIKRITKAF